MKLYSVKLEVQALKTLCDYTDETEKARLLAKLNAEHFYGDACQKAFNRITKLVRQSSEIPSWNELLVDPLLDELSKEELRSARMRKAKSKKSIATMYDNLNLYRKARILYGMSEYTIKQLEKDTVDVDKVISNNADDLVKAQISDAVALDIVTIAKKGNSDAHLKSLLSSKKPKSFRTGFYSFDDKNGGCEPGALVILASTSGGGKSAMGIQLSINMSLAGHRVCFIPLEMTKKACMARIVSNVSGINVKKFIFSNVTKREKEKTWKKWQTFRQEMDRLDGSLRLFEPEIDLSVEEILTFMKPYGDDVVMIDYIGLLRGVDGDDSWRKLGNAARFAKIWAKNNNKVVIMMAQLSDEGAIKYSRTIKEHADNMWSWVYSNESRENMVLDIVQQKARNQEVFDFQLGHDFSVMRIHDLDDNESMDSKRSPEGKKRYERLKDATADLSHDEDYDEIDKYIN